MSPEEFVKKLLKLPYGRVIIPDLESGTFTGELLEFQGCITQGDTVDETYNRLNDVAESWLLATILDTDQWIPLPHAMRELAEINEVGVEGFYEPQYEAGRPHQVAGIRYTGE
jgi:predicted RNase H-like HicB family nuclease